MGVRSKHRITRKAIHVHPSDNFKILTKTHPRPYLATTIPRVNRSPSLPPRTLRRIGFDDITAGPLRDKLLDFAVDEANVGVISLGSKEIKISRCLGKNVLGEDGLVVALAKEVGVDDRRNEGILEGERTQDDTNKNDKFGVCDNFHRRIIIACMPDEK